MVVWWNMEDEVDVVVNFEAFLWWRSGDDDDDLLQDDTQLHGEYPNAIVDNLNW
jgi:hypothetical protein